MRYTVLLEPEEDGGCVVSVPALPGCISQGDTREEALANIREAIPSMSRIAAKPTIPCRIRTAEATAASAPNSSCAKYGVASARRYR